MEFTRLADVEVVETATDVDKVLIEQNGEIKRVPKTEVGGSGNVLVLDVDVAFDEDGYPLLNSCTANMVLDDVINALNNRELTNLIAYVSAEGVVATDLMLLADLTPMVGSSCVNIYLWEINASFYWTADGFSMDEPTPAKT